MVIVDQFTKIIRLKRIITVVLLEEKPRFIEITYRKSMEFQRRFLVTEDSNLPYDSWKT